MGRRQRRFALAVGLSALLAGCSAPPPPADPGKPRRVLDSTVQVEDTLYLPGTHEERLQAFLRYRYGANARLDAAWQDQWDDTEVEAQRPVTRQVCARDTVHTDGHVQHLLAVCQTLDEAASVEPGRLDLYVLRDGKDLLFGNDPDDSMFAKLFRTRPPLLVIAQRQQGQYGRKGAPGTVQIEQLGPQRHAFRITHGELDRGTARASRSYIAVHNNRLREVAMLREHLDNRAAPGCEDTSKTCDTPRFDVDFSISVGDSDALEGYWPLTVRTRGEDCSGAAHEYHLLKFDARSRSYAVPAELQRDDCGA